MIGANQNPSCTLGEYKREYKSGADVLRWEERALPGMIEMISCALALQTS